MGWDETRSIHGRQQKSGAGTYVLGLTHSLFHSLHQASILFSQRVTHRISEAPGYPMIVLIPNKLCVVNKPEVREVRKVISVEVWRDERPYLLCLSPGSTREKGKIYPIKAEIFLA